MMLIDDVLALSETAAFGVDRFKESVFAGALFAGEDPVSTEIGRGAREAQKEGE